MPLVVVHFDARRHLFRRASDLRVIPSCTSILRWHGLIPEAGRLKFAKPYLARGRRVHRATETHDDPTVHDDPLSMVLDGEEGYVQAWLEFRRRFHGPQTWDYIERRVHWDGLVAGIVDRAGVLEGLGGAPYAVLDLKTGPKQPWHRLQLGGYVLMLNLPPTTLRLSVHLKADGTYTMNPYTDPRDVYEFRRLTLDWWETDHATDDEEATGTLVDD